jgi:hypothetical protein
MGHLAIMVVAPQKYICFPSIDFVQKNRLRLSPNTPSSYVYFVEAAAKAVAAPSWQVPHGLEVS